MARADQSELQKRFIRRLAQEMQERGWSANALAKAARRRGYTISQSTVSRILDGTQDPTLGKVSQLADTMGFPEWFLLTEREQMEERIIRAPAPQNIHKLPTAYPKVFGNNDTPARAKTKRRK